MHAPQFNSQLRVAPQDLLELALEPADKFFESLRGMGVKRSVSSGMQAGLVNCEGSHQVLTIHPGV